MIAPPPSASQELIHERERPELAWVFYHVTVRRFSAAVRRLRARASTTGSPAHAGGDWADGEPDTAPGGRAGILPPSQARKIHGLSQAARAGPHVRQEVRAGV